MNSTAEISHGMYKTNGTNTIISGIASGSLSATSDVSSSLLVWAGGELALTVSDRTWAGFARPALYRQSPGDGNRRVSRACVSALVHSCLFPPDVFLLSLQTSVFLGIRHARAILPGISDALITRVLIKPTNTIITFCLAVPISPSNNQRRCSVPP